MHSEVILEALEKVYTAPELVKELREGKRWVNGDPKCKPAMPSPLTDCASSRLHFRTINAAEHALAVHAMNSDPEVMRYLSPEPPPSWDDFAAGFPEWLTAIGRYGPGRGFWAAHRNDDRAFLGWFHLRPSRLFEQRLELGYRLRRAVWGQGFATEGAQALVDYGFRELGAPEVIALTLTRNLPSRRVMEKVGMAGARIRLPAGGLSDLD